MRKLGLGNGLYAIEECPRMHLVVRSSLQCLKYQFLVLIRCRLNSSCGIGFSQGSDTGENPFPLCSSTESQEHCMSQSSQWCCQMSIRTSQAELVNRRWPRLILGFRLGTKTLVKTLSVRQTRCRSGLEAAGTTPEATNRTLPSSTFVTDNLHTIRRTFRRSLGTTCGTLTLTTTTSSSIGTLRSTGCR